MASGAVEVALNELGFGPSGRATLIQCGLVAAAAGALTQARFEFGVSETSAKALSSFVIGGEMAGAVVWGLLADVLGRAEVTILASTLAAGATLVCGFAVSFEALCAAGCAAGCAVGGMAVAPVVLLVERAPYKSRGAYAVSLAVFVALGQAAAAAVDGMLAAATAMFFLSSSSKEDYFDVKWRLVLVLVSLAPCGAALSCAKRLPESIRWLLARHRDGHARRSLTKALLANAPTDAARLALLQGGHHQALAALDAAVEDFDTKCAPLQPVSYTARLRRLAGDTGLITLCTCGLAFLLEFASASIVALIRLEFDEKGRSDASDFYALSDNKSTRLGLPNSSMRRHLLLAPLGSSRRALASSSSSCPALDYGIVALALGAAVLGAGVARHLVDVVGRRVSASALLAVGAAGVLALATPEYVAEDVVPQLSRSSLLMVMMAARGALRGAAAVVAVFVAELHSCDVRCTVAAGAYAAARLGALASTYWVVAPNPLSTVSLLVTLVAVSASWAALAMPVETGGFALRDGLAQPTSLRRFVTPPPAEDDPRQAAHASAPNETRPLLT